MNEKKEKVIQIRLTKNEHKNLIINAKKLKTTIAVLFRKLFKKLLSDEA